MGINENKVRSWTPANIADELMRIAPQVQDVVMAAVTADGRVILMRTPIAIMPYATCLALLQHDLNGVITNAGITKPGVTN